MSTISVGQFTNECSIFTTVYLRHHATKSIVQVNKKHACPTDGCVPCLMIKLKSFAESAKNESLPRATKPATDFNAHAVANF